MPKIEREIREEDSALKEPFHLQYLKQFMNPSDESLPANSRLPYAMTTPMAEMAVMEMIWASMIAHQLLKAEEYSKLLSENDRTAYNERLEAFKEEHYEDYPECKKPKFASTVLRKHISLYSLSVMGGHHDDTKDITTSIIESLGIPGEIKE